MTIEKCGLFILVMMNIMCQCMIHCTGYYGNMYKHGKVGPLKTHYWIKHQYMKVPVHKYSHPEFFPPSTGYYFKAPSVLAPKSVVTQFSKFVPTSGAFSPGWNFPYQVTNSKPMNENNDFYTKRNPKYLWLDFPDRKKNDHLLALKTVSAHNNHPFSLPEGLTDGSVTRTDIPGSNVDNIYVPNEGDLQTNPTEVDVVSLQPKQPLHNTDGFGPQSTSDTFNGFTRTDPNAPGVLQSTDTHKSGGGNLPNGVNAFSGNPTHDVTSFNGILPDSINSVPIQVNKLQSGISLTGGNTPEFGGVGNLNGNLLGTESGNVVLSVGGDPAQLFDASVGTGNVLVNPVPLLESELAGTNTVGVSLKGGDFPNTYEIDGHLSNIVNSVDLPGAMSIDIQVNGNDISGSAGDSRGIVLLSDGTSNSNRQSDIIVTPADPSRVRKIHQPLAKPLSLMLTVEPFGPGPYGTCREPSRVVCGARYGWEHVVGMAAWCKQNCVVFMYTSYCDDDRCQCECENVQDE